jgi:aminopeptidase N
MEEMNVNVGWLLVVAIPSLLATISSVKRLMKDSGSVDNEQNQAIVLINAELLNHRKEIDRLATRLDQADGRITSEIKELEKKIEGRFDQLVTLITNALKK